MTNFRTRAALLAGVMTLTGATMAFAAAAPAADAPKVERSAMDGPGMQGPGRGKHGPMNPEMKAQHLRDALQLRPDQDAALKAFVAATTPDRDGMHRRMDGDASPPAPMTTPERLDKQAAMMAKHHEMFEKRAAATRTFYAQLSPSQKKAFDALPMGGHGKRGKHERRGGPAD
ncbi:MAG: Spy/CpxP family protein refolding chaperone [Caulobacter sp.]|nr:Spy/CpxP family protein refolding chaperone [Caulobacter sp.]